MVGIHLVPAASCREARQRIDSLSVSRLEWPEGVLCSWWLAVAMVRCRGVSSAGDGMRPEIVAIYFTCAIATSRPPLH